MASGTMKKEVGFFVEKVAYNGTAFPVSKKPYSDYGQYSCTARNVQTGAIYIVWYDGGSGAFRMGAVINGSAPTTGQEITLQYPI